MLFMIWNLRIWLIKSKSMNDENADLIERIHPTHSLDPTHPDFELITLEELVKRTGRGIDEKDVLRWINERYIQPVKREPDLFAPYHPFLAKKINEMETMLQRSPERIEEYCSSFKTYLSQIYHFIGKRRLKAVIAINESLLKSEGTRDITLPQETIEAIKKAVAKDTTKAQLKMGLQGLIESTVGQIEQVDLFRRQLEGELHLWYQTLEDIGDKGSLPKELSEIIESAHARVFPRPDIEQALVGMLFPNDERAIDLKELETVQAWNESVVCPKCSTRFSLENVLRGEAQIKAYFLPDDKFKFRCPDCGHIFDWRENYASPQRYSPKMKNVCQNCGNFFKPRKNVWDRQKFCRMSEECKKKARSVVNRGNYLKRKALLEKSNNSGK